MALGSKPGIDSAPAFDITINGYDIDANLGQLVQSVAYDSGDGIIDEMKLTIANPEFVITDKKLFRPGNIIKLWGGYGPERYFIGGARIEKVRPNFPEGGSMPSVEIIGYTGDILMTRNAPQPWEFGKPFEPVPDTKFEKKAAKAEKAKHVNDGRTWAEGLMYSDAIADKAGVYGFRADVDPTPAKIIGPLGVFQKADMTDFDFVMAIANELGWLFWVDADELTETWVLHFKDPDTTAGIQSRKYDFAYRNGDQSTCESFEAEELLADAPTQLRVQFKNTEKNQLEEITVDVDPTSIFDSEYAGLPDEEPLLRPPNKPIHANEITIAFGEVAVKTISDRQFGSVAEAHEWAKAWYVEHVRDYTRGTWQTRGPGTETLTARQVHSVSGVGTRYSGDYYVTNVSQSFSTSGHSVRVNGRKIGNNV